MTLVRIEIRRPAAPGPDVPAVGFVRWTPSKRRDVDDYVVLPKGFSVRLGDDFLDEDGVVVTSGEPGIAWVEVAPSDVPIWTWTVAERTDRGRGTTWVEVPDQAQVEYNALTVLDPDTLDPDVDATAAWYLLLNQRVPESGTTGFVLTKGAGATNTWSAAGAGSGDVVGPASSTDNRVVRFDGTTGKLIQESPVTIDDAGAITGMTTVDGRDVSVDGAALDGHIANTSNPHTVTKTQVGLPLVDNVQQQPLDADLTTIAGLTPTTDNVIQSVAGSWASRTIAQLKATLGLATVATSGDYDDLTDKPSALPPNGGAGGVLSGTYPSPGFAVDMATQAELDAKLTDSMATDKVLGRDTAGTGAVEQLGLVGATISGGNLVITGGGSGDVVGPASSTDNEIVRFDSTTGKLIQSSATPVTISDAGSISLPGSQTVDGRDVSVDGTKLDGIEALADVTDAANVAAAGGYVAGGTDVAVADGGTGRSTATTAYGLIAAGTTAAGVQQTVTPGTSGHLLKSNGAAALASFAAGAPADVGLGNVDNTSDADKPISDDTQIALDQRLEDGQFTVDGLMVTNGAGAYGSVDIAGTTNRVTVANGDGQSGNPTIDVGTDVYTAGGTDVAVADGGTGRSTATTAYGLIAAGTTAAGIQQTVSPGTSGHLLKSAGGSALAAFAAGAPGDVALGNVDNTSNATERAAAATLTNKRITRRVSTTASTATLTIDADSFDDATVTAQAAALTIAAPTGTPTVMQPLKIRIKDNGTARALTWNAAFRAIGVTLPTTTAISKTMYVGAVWNEADSKWDVLATAAEA